jgi:hypothetical protein
MTAQSPPKPSVACPNCQSIVAADASHCGRCGVRVRPDETYRHYKAGRRPTLDMIEGNWEEYHG